MTTEHANKGFNCTVCECEMSGKDAYDSHMVGARHAKNVKHRAEGEPLLGRRAGGGGGKTAAAQDIKKIKAQDLFLSATKPLIGIEYVTEHQSNQYNVHARYQCAVCDTFCDVNSLVSHVSGKVHRHNYIKKHRPELAEQVHAKQEEIKNIPEGEDKKGSMRVVTEMLEEFATSIEAETGRGTMTIIEDHSPPTVAPVGSKQAVKQEPRDQGRGRGGDRGRGSDRGGRFGDRGGRGGRGGGRDGGRDGGFGGKRPYDDSNGYGGPAKRGRGSRGGGPPGRGGGYHSREPIQQDPYFEGRDYFRPDPYDLPPAPMLPPAPQEPINLVSSLRRITKILDYDTICNEQEAQMALNVSNALSEQLQNFRKRTGGGLAMADPYGSSDPYDNYGGYSAAPRLGRGGARGSTRGIKSSYGSTASSYGAGFQTYGGDNATFF